jgi:hypothetical protein
MGGVCHIPKTGCCEEQSWPSVSTGSTSVSSAALDHKYMKNETASVMNTADVFLVIKQYGLHSGYNVGGVTVQRCQKYVMTHLGSVQILLLHICELSVGGFQHPQGAWTQSPEDSMETPACYEEKPKSTRLLLPSADLRITNSGGHTVSSTFSVLLCCRGHLMWVPGTWRPSC